MRFPNLFNTETILIFRVFKNKYFCLIFFHLFRVIVTGGNELSSINGNEFGLIIRQVKSHSFKNIKISVQIITFDGKS